MFIHACRLTFRVGDGPDNDMHVSKSKGVDSKPNNFYFVGAKSMCQVDKSVERPLRNYDAQNGEQRPRCSVENAEVKSSGRKG